MNDKKKHYLVYKTTNDLNGMYYIGKHATTNPNDSYLGSGVYLTRAIEKYGKEHFHKEILFDFDTEEEMNAKERELVNENLVKDETCYNLMLGGEGGDTWTGTGRKHSEETRKKLSEHSKKQWQSDETREKFRQSVEKTLERKRKECPEQIREMYIRIAEKLRGRPSHFSESHRNAISEGIRRHYDKEGRSPLIKKSGYLTQEASDSASGKGKIVVHHKELKEVKRINPDELQSYLDKGWERGYLNKKRI